MVGGPAIFFKYGTDQSGYAQMSDWLLHFPVSIRPVNDGGAWPYQSYPEILFGIDPRFGTFGLLAIISAAVKTDGLFSYPLATCVVVACGITSCVGVFTRRIMPFILGVLLLVLSQWVDYGYTGFFGRTVGYPAIIVLAGFALRTLNGDRRKLMALLVIAGAAGTSYPGFVVGILVATIILPWLIFRRIFDVGAKTADDVFAAAVAVVVPFMSSGVASRPVGVGQFLPGLDWQTVLPRVLDVDDRTIPVTALSPNILLYMTFICLIGTIILIVLALMRKNTMAIAIMVGPLAFVLALLVAGRTSAVQEFAGLPYPTLVVGGLTLIEGGLDIIGVLVTSIMVIEGMIRIPRLYSTLFLFAYTPDPDYVFTLAEVKQIRDNLKNRSMQIETGSNAGKALWLMTEFGQLKGQVSWAPDTWQVILAYRPEWTYKPTVLPPETRLRIDLSKDLHHHFTLQDYVP